MKTGIAKAISSIALALTVAFAGCSSDNNTAGRCKAAASCLKQVKTPVITADCVARYFTCNAGPYVTNQKHVFSPDTQALGITSYETLGDYKWCLNGNNLRIQTCKKQINSSAICYFDTQSALLLNKTVLTGAGLAAKPDMKYLCKSNVRIQGILYKEYAYDLAGTNFRMNIYQRCDNSKIDRLQITDLCTGKIFNSYAYNYVWVEKICKSLPGKIDIYEGSAALIDRNMISQFEYTLFD